MQKCVKNAKNSKILHNYLIVNINMFKREMASNEGMLVKNNDEWGFVIYLNERCHFFLQLVGFMQLDI